jgi:hypothetical protein
MTWLAIRVRLARSVTHTTGTVPVCRLTAVRPGVPIATLTAAPPATNALPQDGGNNGERRYKTIYFVALVTARTSVLVVNSVPSELAQIG